MGNVFYMHPKPPYSIRKHLELFSLGNNPVPCIYSNGVCRRAVRNDRNVLAFKVKVVSEGFNPCIKVIAICGNTNEVRKIVEHIYNVNLDYSEFLSTVKNIPKLYSLALKYLGLRPALTPTLYEALIKAIINQRIPLKIANAIISRVVRRYGFKVIFNNEEYYDFPNSNELAKVNVDELRELGLSRRKAGFIINISKAVSEGYDLEALKRGRYEEVISELTKFKGVGLWTAQLAYAASTGDMSVGPEQDLAVRRGLSLIFRDEKIPNSVWLKYRGLIMYLASLEYEVRFKAKQL